GGGVGGVEGAVGVGGRAGGGSTEGGVGGIHRGARDYIQKPWDNARLVATLSAQLELRRALRAATRLDAEAARTRANELPPIVAESRAMAQVMALVQRVAPAAARV